MDKPPTPQSQSPFSSVKTPNSIISRSQKNLLTLWVRADQPSNKRDGAHADQPPKPDVILNPDCLPDVKLGQLLEVYRSNERSDVTKHLIFKVDHTDRDKENVVNSQISVSGTIASIFQFNNMTNVYVKEVDPESVTADYVEFTFKDQYVGRSDMWRLSRSLIGTCLYVKQEIKFAGCITAQIKKIFVHGEQRLCGYVKDTTKPIFRSESAKLFIFVQMSKEMWEFDEDGELYYEKAVNGFFTELFQHWKDLGTNHIVSIVLFTRVYYDKEEVIVIDRELIADESLLQIKNRWYKDYYKVIVDWETRTDWNSALGLLKEELMSYQEKILLRKRKHPDGETYETLLGKNSYSFEGNILEAINLALNPFDRHYVDRDLLRTGLSIVVVTPGCCRFEVDKKLLRMTSERMIDNGIGLDIVCLSRIPLHTVPLFKFNSQEISKAPLPSWWAKSSTKGKFPSLNDLKLEYRDPLDYDDQLNEDANHPYYKTPDWLDCNFYSRHQDKPPRSDKFITRCKMYEVQMTGIMENAMASILIPQLDDDSQSSSSNNELNYFDSYDNNIFGVPKRVEPILPPVPPLRKRKSQENLTFLNYQFGQDTALAKFDDKVRFQSISRDLYHETPLNNEEEETSPTNGASVITTSTVSPISISASNRYQQRTFNSKESFTEGTYIPEKGKYFKLLQANNSISYQNMNPPPIQNLPLVNPPLNYRHPLINPCNPLKSLNRYGTSTRLHRWGHTYPIPLSMNSMKWHFLCTPACLPLTTDDGSTPFDDELGVSEFTYTISVEPSQEHNDDLTEESVNLLKEMISQRLAQGYQLISDVELQPESGKPYYLSMGRHIHKLTYNPLEQIVEVKRYLRKIQYEPKPIPYKCSVWPKYQACYEPRNVNFTYPHIDYQWNYVDQLVCGYQVDLVEHLKFWRTRFILIPTDNVPSSSLKQGNEKLYEEEVRLSGIYKFLELFEKSIWTPVEKTETSNNKRMENLTPPLRPTTDDLSIFVITPEGLRPRKPFTHQTDGKIAKDTNKIIQAMTKSDGIARDLRWHSKFYQNVIIGNEFVDWLITKFDVETRADAVALGNEFLDKGVFEHCEKRHRFLDGYYFYQGLHIAGKPAPAKWFLPKFPKKDSAKPDGSQDADGNEKTVTRIEFTKSMHIDIDPHKKSDRRETATLHYDIIYNVEACYHFQLNWLGCTARLIEELLQQWGKHADKYGLRLIEAPVEQTMSLTDNNPFQSPSIVKLSVLPPSLEQLEKKGKRLKPEINPNLYFEIQLVKHFNFILDIEADDRFPKDVVEIVYTYHKTPYKYSQYIHRSGVAFVQICDPGEGFLWVNNRLYTTHNSSNKYFSPSPDNLLKEFQIYCNDEDTLSKFWQAVIDLKKEDFVDIEVQPPPIEEKKPLPAPKIIDTPLSQKNPKKDEKYDSSSDTWRYRIYLLKEQYYYASDAA